MQIERIISGSCATNCYCLIENGKAVVIDPTDEPQAVIDFTENNKIDITHVLITHGHFDHVGGAKLLKDRGAEIYMSEIDYSSVDILNNFFGYKVAPFDIDTYVTDGHEFELLGHRFKVISTPGHTNGSVCYILDDNTVFSGDTLFYLSVGRTDFPSGDTHKLLISLKKLCELNGNYTVLPGHGQSTELDYERKNNPYVNF